MQRVGSQLALLWLAGAAIAWGCGSHAAHDGHDVASTMGEHASAGAPAQRRRWDTIPEPFDLKIEYSRELFVSPKGDDATGAGSAENPFATLARAAELATPGTRINLGSGFYRGLGSLRRLHGTRMQPIAIAARGRVVINGGGRELGLHLGDPRYVVIEGLEFQNTWPHGMNIDDGGSFESPAQYVVLRNLRFRDIGKGGNNDCLKMSGVRDFWVLSSEFEDCDRGEAIDMVGCHDGVVSMNYFHDIPQHAVQTKGGSADVLIHGNRFRDVIGRSINAGGHTGAPYFRPLDSRYEAMGIHMVANIFERTGDTPVAFVGCEACVFANNTVIAPRSRIARLLWQNTKRAEGEYGVYVNNLLVTPVQHVEPAAAIDIGQGTTPETFRFDNNLMYFRGSNRELPAYALTEWKRRGFLVTTEGPLLEGVSEGDYRLRPGSPAIGVGQAVPGGLPGDFDGRGYEDPPSVGAFRRP